MNTYDYLFETSWEVCNKVGGIHTVVTTKIPTIKQKIGDKHILLGPDLGQATDENSEFKEDKTMFASWKIYAKQNGIEFKAGRWKTETSPVVILVPYTQYFAQKDEIFAKYWETYRVDSLTGGWDYIEPFLFGYASAKIIESFYNFYLSSTDRIVAQFHEWMTGSGLLYLKQNVPQIATSFTTHATVLGRCLAGNNLPLYSEMKNYHGEKAANDFHVRAKFSLEKMSALCSDVFTTVSGITNQECKQFFEKEADVITPNGFEDRFVPKANLYNNLRKEARKKILNFIERSSSYMPDEDSFFILNSGRYEFRNKGIDVFIKTLAKINKGEKLSKKIIAVIAVPAGHYEAVNDNRFLTHRLDNEQNDPILNAIRECGFENKEEDNVHIVFIPSYLDSRDGQINMSYFDFLTGFDLSVFPSYYEPWGYTPMESMAFGIPSVTTSLAGFGLWVKDNIKNEHSALSITERNDINEEDCINGICSSILRVLNASNEEREFLKEDSRYIFSQVKWENLQSYYDEAYSIALEKSSERINLYAHKQPLSYEANIRVSWGDKPNWKKILVKSSLPQRLKFLRTLSQNLWWSWNYDAFELFESIDKKRFFDMERSPVRLLESLTKEDCQRLLSDNKFLEDMDKVEQHFNDYVLSRKEKTNSLIAYFSMEFGIHDTLKIFSGGLGMLAGDYLKQASDSNKNIVGIGLLYRYGYFSQQINRDGEQISGLKAQKFSHLPLSAVRDGDGRWKKIFIDLPSGRVWAKIWLCNVGVTPLYLLDTDIEENSEENKLITRQLYGGDNEMRLKQEILLGIGGIRMLKALDLEPVLYHSNEGHSAFSSLERLNNLINQDKVPYCQALELVRSSTLFTTHTPVPAGHDVFSEDLMRAYFSRYAESLTLDWDSFMLLGRKSNDDRNEKFSVSVLAINCSANINGVSKIHGRVSRAMFNYLFDGYFEDEVPIGHVTNGVHLPTWAAKQWCNLYSEYFGKEMFSDESNPVYWNKIYEVPDEKIWNVHQELKQELIDFIKQRLQSELKSRGENPQLYIKTTEELDRDKLIIGFARRFATYKRAGLLFTDLSRLEQIVNKGICFVFAGKAHPQDKAGQDLIKKIIEVSRMPQFTGKIIFIENYDMYVAKHLVRGCDIWLNTPTRPLEASGTSGEKAIMNGVVNFSVLDGWWAEGYRQGAGWALAEEQTYRDNTTQNILDAQTIYSLLENEIWNTYYNRTDSVPLQWVSHIKNTIAKIAPHFTMKRQLDDYFSKYYNQMFERTELMKADSNKKAAEYSQWKQMMKDNWNTLELLSVDMPDTNTESFSFEQIFKARISLYLGEIPAENIGIEMIIADKEDEDITKAQKKVEFSLCQSSHHRGEYELEFSDFASGVHNYAFRIYPKCTLMPYQQDLNLVKWI
ncbi:MAG: alpha-glucan family phosphorylase [Bacteroidales bacterium]|nr:alpha-glucan family phosphorylase [Bacteroidales bacterium]